MPTGHYGKQFCTLWSLAGLSSNSGVLGNGCPIHCINTLPYYRSMFKRRALLSQSCWSSVLGFITLGPFHCA